MSKKDGEFSKTKTDWHRDPRCKALKFASYKWLNQVLWNLCVKERRETLPPRYTFKILSEESGVDVRTVRKAIAFMQLGDDPLIILNQDQSITVNGVREIHENKKFKFLDVNRNQVPVRVEKSRVEIDSVNEDLPIQETRKPTDIDIVKVANLSIFVADNFHKSDQSHTVQPHILNLLGYGVEIDDLEKAIRHHVENAPKDTISKSFANIFTDDKVVASTLAFAKMTPQKLSKAERGVAPDFGPAFTDNKK